MRKDKLQHAREGLVATLPKVQPSASIQEAFAAVMLHRHHAFVRVDEDAAIMFTLVDLERSGKDIRTVGDLRGGKEICRASAKEAKNIMEAFSKGRVTGRGKRKTSSGNYALDGIAESVNALTVVSKGKADAPWVRVHYSFCKNCQRLVRTASQCCASPNQSSN
jgi:hypothetical protein